MMSHGMFNNNYVEKHLVQENALLRSSIVISC